MLSGNRDKSVVNMMWSVYGSYMKREDYNNIHTMVGAKERMEAFSSVEQKFPLTKYPILENIHCRDMGGPPVHC